MTDFEQTWRLTRGRFEDALAGLNQSQLNWRMHPEALTIGEMALHVAGTEVSFISQLLDEEPTGLAGRLKPASTDGVINDKPFPFSPAEITPELVQQGLQAAKSLAEPIISSPTEAIRSKEIVSVLGPVITGEGAFARLSYHPGYHQGQIHLVKTAPGFPD
ncbi:MAG: DinB family protein [Fimbriimonadaceae bacterium]